MSDSDLELEALEVDESEAFEPLDLVAGERKLVTQPYDYSVDQLAYHVDKKKILLIEVEYQREYVWDDAKASRLMESLLLNVPIPVCYFAENEDGSWEVIDGLQRVHSIVRFLRNEFSLRGLSVLSELNGRRFDELPARDRRRIESRTLRFVVITDESHPDIKFDVFERLNTGAVKLTPQELRNCIYRGKLNDALHRIASDPLFRSILGSGEDARMRNEEIALRFFSLYADLPGYKEPLTQFLNEYMRQHRNEEPDPKIIETFYDVVRTIDQVYGSTAFRTLKEGKPSRSINRALFDAVTQALAFADRKAVVRLGEKVRQAHAKLLEDEDFLRYIARATADRGRMHGRVQTYAAQLRQIGITVNLPDLLDG
jgi:hypothetical protein